MKRSVKDYVEWFVKEGSAALDQQPYGKKG